MKHRLPILLTLMFLFTYVLLTSCSGTERTLHGSPYEPARPAPGIPLQTVDGEEFDLYTLRGDIVLVYFGYTYCPDICPTTLADVKLIYEELGEVGVNLHLIMVTVDPERDTPDVLRTYLARFHPNFLGLHGEDDRLDEVMASYAVFAQKEPSDDPDRYLVSHTARLFLIDQNGVLRTNYPFGTPRDEILTDLERLITEEAR